MTTENTEVQETEWDKAERLKKEAEWRKQAEIAAEVQETRAKAKVKLGEMSDAEFARYCRTLFNS